MRTISNPNSDSTIELQRRQIAVFTMGNFPQTRLSKLATWHNTDVIFPADVLPDFEKVADKRGAEWWKLRILEVGDKAIELTMGRFTSHELRTANIGGDFVGHVTTGSTVGNILVPEFVLIQNPNHFAPERWVG